MGPLLALEGLSVAYGPVQAVRGLDLTVGHGESVALLGPNGAGKSSTLNAVMHLAPVSSGRIRFAGRDLGGVRTEDVVRRGMTMVPEARRIFPSLTVAENLALGAVAHPERAEAAGREVMDLFPILAERRGQQAGTLSGGEQQQLAIARALMSGPRLLLLDEPSLGLAPQIVDRIFELLLELRRRGVTMLLVEQQVDMALSVADRAYVLASGRLRLEGVAADIRASKEVERAYLGIGVA